MQNHGDEMNKNNLGGNMTPSEVKSTVNALETSPSKNAGGSSAKATPGMAGSAESASGSTPAHWAPCFGGGSKKEKY